MTMAGRREGVEEYRAFLEAHPGICGPRRNEREYMRTLRAIRRRFGICVGCSQPAIPGKRRCVEHKSAVQRCQEAPKHREAHRDFLRRQYRERFEAGRCLGCNRYLTIFDAVGVTRCKTCRRKAADIQAEVSKRKRAERKAAGLCLICGRERDDKRFTNCAACRLRNANAARQRYGERAA